MVRLYRDNNKNRYFDVKISVNKASFSLNTSLQHCYISCTLSVYALVETPICIILTTDEEHVITFNFLAQVLSLWSSLCVFVSNECAGQNRCMLLITACGSVVLGFGTVGMALLY